MIGISNSRLAIMISGGCRPTSENAKIDRMITTTRNSVPQRWWAVGYLRTCLDCQRVVRLERMDRHVLGAVVLEDPLDVRHLRDQHQVAEEDPDPDEPLDHVLDEAVLDARRP